MKASRPVSFRISVKFLLVTLFAGLLVISSILPVMAGEGDEPDRTLAVHTTFLPVSIHSWPRQLIAPALLPVDNQDQDKYFTVAWQDAQEDVVYDLEEALDPEFASGHLAFQGTDLSWSDPAGRLPGMYYFRVRARSPQATSEWSVVQSVTIYPLFVGLQVRWDGEGFIRGIDYLDVGYHKTVNFDMLTEPDTIRSNWHSWYLPNPDDLEENFWQSYYSVTTGMFKSSTAIGDPSWHWGDPWALKYDSHYTNGETVLIDGQKFTVTGPYAGYTTYGTSITYWQFVNQEKFLVWDGGNGYQQYVSPGDVILQYDAGAAGLQLYRNIKRQTYYLANLINHTVHYVVMLTAATSLPGSPPVSLAESLVITSGSPQMTTVQKMPGFGPIPHASGGEILSSGQ